MKSTQDINNEKEGQGNGEVLDPSSKMNEFQRIQFMLQKKQKLLGSSKNLSNFTTISQPIEQEEPPIENASISPFSKNIRKLKNQQKQTFQNTKTHNNFVFKFSQSSESSNNVKAEEKQSPLRKQSSDELFKSQEKPLGKLGKSKFAN